MLLTHFVVRILPVGMMVLSAGVVYAQNYPNTFIRIVTTQAGSGNDFTARVIAPAISGGQAGVVHMNNDACNAANRG